MPTRDTDSSLNRLFDQLLDALADRIAERVSAQLATTRPGGKSRLLTVPQAAEYLGRTAPALRGLIKSGRIPVVRLDDRVFLDPKDIERVIEASKCSN